MAPVDFVSTGAVSNVIRKKNLTRIASATKRKAMNQQDEKDLVWSEIREILEPTFGSPAARYVHPIWNKIRFLSGSVKSLEKLREYEKEELGRKTSGGGAGCAEHPGAFCSCGQMG
jgi:hypothetical protein